MGGGERRGRERERRGDFYKELAHVIAEAGKSTIRRAGTQAGDPGEAMLQSEWGDRLL